jgi:putative transposase
LNVSRSGMRYTRTKPTTDAPALAQMKALALQYPRYGYRRISVFMARQGHPMSPSRAWRLWKGAGLQVPRKRTRKRIAHANPRPLPPAHVNHVWSYDFIFDSCANGQQLKCLTLVDEFTRERLLIDVGCSIRSRRAIELLGKLLSKRGIPRYLRSDNGPEFVARTLAQWVRQQGLQMALIDPGKPWQNGANESFNGKFRDECLNMEWFRNRMEARIVIEDWRRHYNEVRPHSSLGYMTPQQAATMAATSLSTQARL